MHPSSFHRLKIFFVSAIFLAIPASSIAAEPLYKNPDKPIDARVKDLLKRMTLEEKVLQLQTVWAARQKLETE